MQNKYIVAEKTAPFSVASVSHELKRVSVTTTASVRKLTTWATWALLFWHTWPASSVCKPTTFVVTERGLKDWIPWDPPARQQKKTKKKCRKKIASLFFNESLGYFAVICDGFVKFDIYFS